MSNRALRIGDRVAIRPDCVAQLAREWQHYKVKPHEAFDVAVNGGNVRRSLGLLCPDDHVRWVWPSQLRLADGATERADVRFEQRAAEIEAMKAAKRKQKKGARKP